MPGRWRATRQALGPLRRIHFVLELSQVQIHQAGNDRREMFATGLRWRFGSQEVSPRKSFLWLRELSQMRNCLLGQTHQRKMSAVRETISAGEDNEEGDHEILL